MFPEHLHLINDRPLVFLDGVDSTAEALSDQGEPIVLSLTQWQVTLR